MKIAYARVSTTEQSENSSALEQKIARLQAHNPDEILQDVQSGSQEDRPSYLKLKALIKSGKVSEVIVTHLDRLNRSLRGLLDIFDLAKMFKVVIKSLDNEVNTSTSAGQFHLSLIGGLAQMEVDRLSERTKHGWQHTRDQQKAVHPPFGYTVKNNKYVLNQTEFLCLLKPNGLKLIEDKTYTYAQLAREQIRMFFETKSLNNAVASFKKKFDFSPFTSVGLKAWLSSPVLLGHTCYLKQKVIQGKLTKLPENLWDIRYDTHPLETLLTYTDRAEIDKIFNHNRKFRGFSNTRKSYAASGLVYCSLCATSMSALSTHKGRYKYYNCRKKSYSGCESKKHIKMAVINQCLFDTCLEQLKLVTENTPLPTEEHTAIDDRILELQNQLKGLESLGFNHAFEAAKRQIQEQINHLQVPDEFRFINTTIEQDRLDQLNSLVAKYSNCSAADLDNIELSGLFNTFIDKLWIRDGQIEKVDLKKL